MAVRAVWSGAISFGLVNVPVRLTTATRSHDIRFNQLRRADNSRIKQKRVAEADGSDVPFEELVKGYEIAPGRYVVITPEELDSVAPKASRLIEIEDFVGLDEIDPLHYESSYYLLPDRNAEKAYALFLRALSESSKVAIGRFVMRQKEYLVSLRALEGVLTLQTLRFADEIVPRSVLENLPGTDSVPDRELAMAHQLVESLTTTFEAARYRDTYRDAVLAMIERKADGETIDIEKPAAEAPPLADLMAALEASLQQAKARRAATATPA